MPVNVLAISVSLLFPINVQAGIENDMANMFNSMGVESNYTQAGAFHGQAGSLYTGGSLTVRTPVSDIQLANMQLPSVNAGCGGIDFFGGAFSFVNKEQFIQFTRNLGNNAAGVAFDLALKALDPMIQDAIGGIRDLVNQINRANLNSCEMGKQLAGGVIGVLGSSINQNCRAAAVASGRADDGADANWVCNFGDNLVAEAEKVRGTNTPQDTISFTGGNLTYEAVKKAYGSLSDYDMDFYTSLMGTAVFTPLTQKEGDKIQVGVQVFAPKITNAKYLLEGKYYNEKNSEQVTIDMWQCRDGAKKLHENCTERKDVKITSIRYTIQQTLSKMKQKLQDNSAWSDQEILEVSRLVNNTKLPVLKMGISDAFLNTNNFNKSAVIDAIAIDYVSYILERNEKLMRTALGFYNKTDEAGDAKAQTLFDNLAELRSTIAFERQAALRAIEAEQALMNSIAQFDSQWRAQFMDTANSLSFDQSNRL